MYLREENKIWLATGKQPVYLLPRMINRHGLVAGATGTGKTVSIKILAEALSDMGVPVFMADVKGDVSGICRPGEPNRHVDERARDMNIADFTYSGYPARIFDVYGKKGIPVRTTVSGMGPVLLARLLGLNDTQSGVLQIIFKIADDNGLLLIDLKDLRAMAQYAGENAKEFTTAYGNITTQSVGAIQRSLLALSGSGGDAFFGEPELDLRDWLACDSTGRGYINILDCVTLIQSPLLYSTFLLWMLSELYEMLPEAGDLEKPRIAFFFDEAHLLFNGAPKALLQKVEQVARLIRSKGVGIYFITQSPSDIPDTVLSQLGNKIQHALRAYTPKDQKAVRAAAASFRANPDFDCESVLGELAIGEALVSVLDGDGAPQMVQRAFMLPPRSFLGVAGPERLEDLLRDCPLYAKYRQAVDRVSAFETLQQNAAREQQKQQQAALEAQLQKQRMQLEKERQKMEKERSGTSGRRSAGVLDKAASSVASSLLTQIGRQVGASLLRGLFSTLKK